MVSAKVVGNTFVNQYYLVLKNTPQHLHKVYKADSKIKRPGLDGIMRDFTFSDIDANDLNMLSSRGFDSVTVTSVISQDSLNGGIFVTVDGYFTSNERQRARNFIQVFFLASQGNCNYYASNDLFKFVDISEANQSIPSANNVVEENVPETVQVADESSDASVVQIGQGQHVSSPEIKTDAVDDTVKGNNQESQEVTDDAAIFVTNLPQDATFALVETAFKRFGEIIRGGSEVRHKWKSSYGFVEFKEANAAHKALQASPILIGGRNAYVVKSDGPIEVTGKVHHLDQETYICRGEEPKVSGGTEEA
ncbi:Nuclear transport factor 2 [Cardamine amara subsp. amara]|uniref:Nuclear transport factor 2 n=1 Tax=Cardamine amara subsp. amara TaxID=228776 RepID=A0ABD1AYZ2_CARAN